MHPACPPHPQPAALGRPPPSLTTVPRFPASAQTMPSQSLTGRWAQTLTAVCSLSTPPLKVKVDTGVFTLTAFLKTDGCQCTRRPSVVWRTRPLPLPSVVFRLGSVRAACVWFNDHLTSLSAGWGCCRKWCRRM